MLQDESVIMPFGVAKWLKMNTKLTNRQISEFTKLNQFEVDIIYDKQLAVCNPISTGQLTKEEIKKCEDDSQANLHSCLKPIKPIKKKYVSLFFKSKKSQMILWVFEQNIDADIVQVTRFFSSRKDHVLLLKQAVISHNGKYGKSINPLSINFCKSHELDQFLIKS